LERVSSLNKIREIFAKPEPFYLFSIYLTIAWISYIYLSSALGMNPMGLVVPFSGFWFVITGLSISLFIFRESARKNFVPLVLGFAATIFLLKRRSIELCQIDDGYHCDKIILFLKNWDVASMVLGKNDRSQYVLSGMEGLWAPLFAVTGTDWLPRISQGYALLAAYAAFRFWESRSGKAWQPSLNYLVMAALLTGQHFWGAFSSGYIDGTPTMVFLILCLLTHTIFFHKEETNYWMLALFSACTGLVIVSKTPNIPWGVLFFILLALALFRLAKSKSRWLAFGLAFIPCISSILFLLQHMISSYRFARNPFYPASAPILDKVAEIFPFIPPPVHGLEGEHKIDGLKDYAPLWRAHWIFDWTESPRVRVLLNWLLDYKFRIPTADPFVGTMGPIWTWVLAPAFCVFFVWFFLYLFQKRKTISWLQWSALAVFSLGMIWSYLFFFMAFYQRLMMGPNYVILFVALVFFHEKILQWAFLKNVRVYVLLFAIALGLGQFVYNINGIYEYSPQRSFAFLWDYYKDREATKPIWSAKP
jgi:hypothetical protein